MQALSLIGPDWFELTKRRPNGSKKEIIFILITLALIIGLIFNPLSLLFVVFLSTKSQDSEFWYMGVGAREYGNGFNVL